MFHDPVIANEIVVGYRAEESLRDIVGVARNVHVLLNEYRLIEPHERAFHQIVTLAMAVESLLLGFAVPAHELIVRVPNVFARGSGFQHAECKSARLKNNFKIVLQFLRCFAKHATATELGVHPLLPPQILQLLSTH